LIEVFLLWVAPLNWSIAFSSRSLKACLHDQQLLKRWWIPGVVVFPSFSVRRVGIDEIEKGKLWEVKG
jgi:hypothetical protein